MLPSQSTTTESYRQFLAAKSQSATMAGFDPLWMPDFLFDFQASLDNWLIRKGRGAVLADCGMGKTPIQLVYAQNCVMKTNKPALVLTPLAVASQTVREADKFKIEAVQSRGGKMPTSAKIVVTNYEQLEHYTSSDFSCVVCDEASILKNFDGVTKAAVTEFMRLMPYRLLCTATAAPNDYIELGTLSEAIGELGFTDMVTRFFKKENKKDYLGWGRVSYKMRGHAEEGFWKWICSWARACRKPSDLGFDDAKFILPELVTREHEVKASRPAAGRLFDVPAENLQEQNEEQRRTIPERCAKVAELVNHKDPAVVWCYRNEEADTCEELIDGALQVSGTQSDELKEERFAAFSSGQLRCLVVKPKMGCLGLNWQHCAHMTFFPSHSFEQFYQGTRRCWRFGQKKKVIVDIVSTEGGAKVLASLNRKADAAAAMFDNLVRHMNDSIRVETTKYGTLTETVPSWLSSSRS